MKHVFSGKPQFKPFDLNDIFSNYMERKYADTKAGTYFVSKSFEDSKMQIMEYSRNVDSVGGRILNEAIENFTIDKY